jgi:hypothetical protein
MTMKSKRASSELDAAALGWGFVIGLLLGGIGALFKAPNHRQISDLRDETWQKLRSRLESIVPSDPIAESMAEGKAAAQHRRAELGLDG